MHNPISKPLCWFDQKFSTKDSLQMLVMAALIALIVATKCYMVLAPPQKIDAYHLRTAADHTSLK